VTRARSAAAAGLLAAACASLVCGVAAAEDGEERGADAVSEVRTQAEKVLRLMRENEAALLEASRAGGEAPPAVKVEPPAGAEAKRDPTTPSGSGGDDDAKRRARLDEVVRESVERGRSIPKELEELVRMIPP
jgi:hypothetical protein